MAKEERKVDADILAELEAGNEAYQQSKAREVQKELPKARYNFRGLSANVTRSSGGDLQLVWALEVIDGEFKGTHAFKNWRLVTDENFEWFRRNILDLELPEPGTKREIATMTCDQLEGICFEGAVSPSNMPGLPNIYINPRCRRQQFEGANVATDTDKAPTDL